MSEIHVSKPVESALAEYALSWCRAITTRAGVIAIAVVLSALLQRGVVAAQEVAISGSECDFFAPDCSTLVSSNQELSVSISISNGDAVAICRTALPEGVTPPERKIRCNFRRTKQRCTINPEVAQIISSSANQNNTIASETNSSLSQATSSSAPIVTKDWRETITRNGQVSIVCRSSS
jgi:hypothetical protein